MAHPDRDRISLERLVEETVTVYSLPFFYERLNEAINHPRSSIADIGRIITEDQGLTARILKLANSPLFGYHSRVDSITRALTIIGTQQLRDLALAASVMGIFKGIPEDLMGMTSFWKHSIACGTIARNLATSRREVNVERFFVAGMLHDLGQLVMCTAIPGTVREMLEESRDNESLHFATERRRLGFDHATVGGAILKKWKIPPNIAEPVACHHIPVKAEQFPLETSIIHLADIICQAMEFGFSGEWYVPPLATEAWDRVGIPVSMLSAIIRQSEQQLEETFAILTENG
ncbi:HDOD domain-containing protein [Geobacter sulfurreducens]|jgi:HD-like signal output (HDOD) protein|uniref:HDOD domain-containing protein n=1 Tax=Geobacter sulfurreducens TaxID=35554 RepID=UPI001BDDC3CE|nr:HDOD domain-containing protein [Geobacter sulfurreducens]QVW36148.1 HDOD domain-containing protein [Geobacter sulfurreducens]UTG93587.1 HDOD domain-containing protein [Geobacter sulfurreducens]